MKSLKSLALVLALTLISVTPALAHSSGHGPQQVTNAEVIAKASYDLGQLIQKGEKVDGQTLDDSWNKATEKKIHKKDVRYYVVSIKHPETGKEVFVLLTRQGQFGGVNFTGSFDCIK
ncbi:DUF6488 family protein [Terasakiella pusilla]|uniref:DUF6488 family protein n=1 Tax=Terasakiella pusilla TaxID=64973 RepID=UPI003AA88F35